MTLHNTVSMIQKGTKYVLIGGGAILALIFLYRFGIGLHEKLFPKPPVPPDVKYGKLPSVPFGEPALQENFKYVLNLLNGDTEDALPIFADRVNIYKIIHNPDNLLNGQEADRRAQALGFVDQQGIPIPHTNVTDTVYQWQETATGQNLPRTLTMDTTTFDFTLSSPYLTYGPVLDSAFIANQDGAKAIASRTLNGINTFYDDIDQTKTTAELLSIKNGVFVPATSVSSTKVVRVDFFQKDIDKLPIYYPRQPHSTMDFLIAARALDISDVLDVHFTHKQIKLPAVYNPDPLDSASYPIKTAKEAYKELVDGKGFIANYFGSSKTINITDVTLGYFLSDSDQDYLMPVIAFHGNDGEFWGFVSAVKDEWIAD